MNFQPVRKLSGYSTNVRFVDAVYNIGGHRVAGERFCASMNIPPPPTDPAWAQISDKIHAVSTKVANQPKAETAKEYRKDHGIMDKQIGDAIVSCDGTWQCVVFKIKMVLIQY